MMFLMDVYKIGSSLSKHTRKYCFSHSRGTVQRSIARDSKLARHAFGCSFLVCRSYLYCTLPGGPRGVKKIFSGVRRANVCAPACLWRSFVAPVAAPHEQTLQEQSSCIFIVIHLWGVSKCPAICTLPMSHWHVLPYCTFIY